MISINKASLVIIIKTFKDPILVILWLLVNLHYPQTVSGPDVQFWRNEDVEVELKDIFSEVEKYVFTVRERKLKWGCF